MIQAKREVPVQRGNESAAMKHCQVAHPMVVVLGERRVATIQLLDPVE